MKLRLSGSLALIVSFSIPLAWCEDVQGWTDDLSGDSTIASVYSESASDTSAPDEEKSYMDKNAMYFELFGQGILYSTNYERAVTADIRLRIGFSAWSWGSEFAKSELTAFPVILNYLPGESDSRLEVGLGLIPALGEGWGGSNIVGTATIGYRYQPRDNEWLFRIGITPLFTFNRAIPWIGFSTGGTF